MLVIAPKVSDAGDKWKLESETLNSDAWAFIFILEIGGGVF